VPEGFIFSKLGIEVSRRPLGIASEFGNNRTVTIKLSSDLSAQFEPSVADRLPHTDLEQKSGKLLSVNSL
jgi:hypothetical protein